MFLGMILIMLQEVKAMHGKIIRIFVSSCIILTVGGCSFKKSENKESTPEATIVESKSLDKYGLKNITSLKSEDATVLLKDSKALPYSDNTTFTPLALNDKGEVFGESIKEDKTVVLLMLNVDTGVYKEMFSAEKDSMISVHGVNDTFVLFSVVNQSKGNVAYYCMDIANKANDTIFESTYANGMTVSNIAIVDNVAYFSLPTPNKNNDNLTYPLIRYDMKNKKQETIEEKTTASPVYFKKELYYIGIDNTKKTTEIVQYNFETKKKSILAKGNEQDGNYQTLSTDGSSLVVQLMYANNSSYFYKVEGSPTKITPYLTINGATFFRGYNGYFTWEGEQENDKKVRKPISFFDSNKQIVYKYDGNLIYFSKKGILWVKYKIDESKIPKMEIFTKDHSVLMWQPFT